MRKVALILCFILSFNFLAPLLVHANSNDIQRLEAYNGDIFDNNILINSPVSIHEIENYLVVTKGHKRTSNNDEYVLNPYVFQKYKIITYTDEDAVNEKIAGLSIKGSPTENTQSRENENGETETIEVDEYRYLGYDVTGIELITNDFYPADSKTISDAKDRHYVYGDPKIKSWSKSVLDNSNMLHYYLKSKVQNDDEKEGVYKDVGYSIEDITHVNDYDTLLKFPRVMSDVSFTSPATLKMIHMVGGSQWYDTVRLKQFNYGLETKIEVVEVDVKLPVDTEFYDIEYSVSSLVKDITTDTVSKDGRYINLVKIDGDYEKDLFTNDLNKNIDLPSLKESNITKKVDLRGFKPDVREKIVINANSIVETFDGGKRTSKAEPVEVYITLVANDTVDFTINRNETDVTDGTVTVDNIANPNLTLTLKDTSFIESGDVTERVWKVRTPTVPVTVSGGNYESVSYTITGANKNCIIDGAVTFIEYVSTADGLIGSKEHKVNVLEKSTPSGPSSGVVAVLTSDADFNEKKDYYEVMEGERFTLRGNKSYHEAGLKLTDYSFDVGEEFVEGIIYRSSKKNIGAFYPNSDGGSVYKAYLDVTAEDGSVGDDKIRTKVHPAEFDPEIEVYGSFKENRKLSFFVDNTHNLTYYPIDESSLMWTITPLDGQGDVIRVDGSLSGSQSFDALFKKKGRYKVSVTGEIESAYNTKRYTGSSERIINIAEDLAPVADLLVYESMPRDVENGLMTKIYLYDNSKSLDDDIIVQRIMSYKFDSDNDGDFDDETSIVFHAGNEMAFYILKDHVGDYQFEVKAKEEFGQETINRFITDADKKRGDTSEKDPDEKTTNVYNVPPTVELEVSQHKKVNVIVYEDLDLSEKMKLDTMLTELKTGFLAKKINLDTHYLSPTETVGNRKVYTTYFDSYIDVRIHVEGDDEDRDEIDYVQEMRFLLDSYTSEDDQDVKDSKDPNRFELVSVEWGRSDYEKYKYKGRSKDYEEFYWKELIVKYKENGVEKEKLYNFVYEYEKLDIHGSSNRHDAFEYDTYEIVGKDLVVNEPIVDRHRFVVENNTFRYGADYRPKLNLPTKTSKTVQLKKYNDSDLENILESCKDQDTFFLNLISEEENRIALNKTLLDHLKSKNINYLTLYSDLVNINPLSGRFDELAMGDYIVTGYENRWNWIYYANELVVRLGTMGYRLDQMYSTYIDVGDFELAKKRMSAKDTSLVMQPITDSIYTKGYRYLQRYSWKMAYGLAAIDKKREVDDTDEIDVWNSWKSFRKTSTDRTEFANSFPSGFFHDYCNGLTVMPDGKLVGTRLYLDSHNADFHKRAVYYGSGFVGTLRGVNYPVRYSWNTTRDMYVQGYVHENGNIYFKEGNGNYNYEFINRVIVTEGVDNIRHIEYSEGDKSLYVYTDNLAVKYSTLNGKRTLLADSYIKRNGTSVEIEPNVWLAKDQVFDGYKEIYYNSDGDSWIKFYIDIDDNYYIERKFKSRYIDKTSKTLMGKDVSGLPLMPYLKKISVGDANENGRIEVVDGANMYDSWHHLVGPATSFKKYFMYVGNDGYLYSTKNLDKAFSLIDADEIEDGNVKARPVEYGKFKMIVPAGRSYRTPSDPWSKATLKTLESYENGRVGFNSSYSDTGSTTTSEIKYANLTIGSAGDVVGDNELTASTEHSNSLSNLETMKNYILDIYNDYTTSDSMTILLNDLVNTSMVMMDYEDDPAYAMFIDTEHVDPNYYENSLGKDPGAGKGIRLNHFKYVGHYVMEARVRDNPVGDDDRFDNYRLWNVDNTKVNVYVHRRPVAKMDYILSEKDDHYILRAWDKDSYDLDHESEVNNGIVAWQWSIKEKDETSWTTYDTKEISHGKILSGTTYDVIFKVQDKEGAWSEPVRKEINPEIIPIELDASVRTLDDRFRVDQLPITEYYELYDMVTKYPTPVNLTYALYDGDTLLTTLETLTQDEGVTGYFKTEEDRKLGQFTWHNRTLKVPKTLADGAYTIVIKATAVNNASKSANCLLDVGVRTPINPVPSVDDLWMTGESYEISCRTSIYTDEVIASVFNGSPKEKTVNMTLDEIISEEIDGQIKQTEKVWKATCAVPEDLVDGMYDLVFTGRVLTTPNKSEQATASVQVISLKFDEVILTGAWNHWRGQIDLFGKRMDDMPLRFLSWEKIYFTAKTLGNPEEVYITMSPELEAMSFTDKNGTVFNYKDDFGYEVEFPLALKEIEENVWTGEYILPLAHSSLSWEDRRLKPAYEIIVTAEKNGKRVTYEFTEEEDRGIEITGNVTNLIYEQPMPDRSR